MVTLPNLVVSCIQEEGLVREVAVEASDDQNFVRTEDLAHTASLSRIEECLIDYLEQCPALHDCLIHVMRDYI